jgi:hypothetical protein
MKVMPIRYTSDVAAAVRFYRALGLDARCPGTGGPRGIRVLGAGGRPGRRVGADQLLRPPAVHVNVELDIDPPQHAVHGRRAFVRRPPSALHSISS